MQSLIEFNLSTTKIGRCMIYKPEDIVPDPTCGYIWVSIMGDYRDFYEREIIYCCLSALNLYINQLIGEFA